MSATLYKLPYAGMVGGHVYICVHMLDVHNVCLCMHAHVSGMGTGMCVHAHVNTYWGGILCKGRCVHTLIGKHMLNVCFVCVCSLCIFYRCAYVYVSGGAYRPVLGMCKCMDMCM